MIPSIITFCIASILLFISYRKDGKAHIPAKITNAALLLFLIVINTYQASTSIGYLLNLNSLLNRYGNQHWGEMTTRTYIIFQIVGGIVCAITIPFLLLMAYRIDKGRQFYLGILITLLLPSNTFVTSYLLIYSPLKNIITAWILYTLNYAFIFAIIVVYNKPFMKALFRPKDSTQAQIVEETFETDDILDA